jgi:glycosyltransferase involved in cell wall biosynthesis
MLRTVTERMRPEEDRPRVVIVRGHQANPWELRPWEQPAITDRFAVSYLRSARGWFDTSSLSLESRRVRTLRGMLPAGAVGDLAVRVPGDRYLGLATALRGADIVHAQELGYWYSMQAARLRRRLGYRLVLTVWETIPLLDTYRNVRTRAYRAATLAETDLFLATTERARESLLLEGAPAERIRVCPPGISSERFEAAGRHERSLAAAPTILSAGRLVWEKGHQDVIRALALLRRRPPTHGRADARLLIVGTGPEERRLRDYAGELGLGDAVELRGSIPYDEMPGVYASAACMVLASLPTRFWEEQFGMVLAEAIAAGLPIVASASGAIPEVAGAAARYFAAGDWIGLADTLSEMLAQRHAALADAPARRYDSQAAAARLASAYEELLVGTLPASNRS